MEHLATFFRNELAKLPPERGLFYKDDHRAWIRCPFHAGGNERTPSFTVNLDSRSKAPLGYCGCFGCKAKMPWNSFAEQFGLLKVSAEAVTESKEGWAYRPRDENAAVPPSTKHMLPWSKLLPWRGISADVVTQFNGKTCAFRDTFALYLPVTKRGDYVGGVTALIERKPGELGYFNTAGEWAQNALFGFDQAAARLKAYRSAPLWITEGPRDCLHVHEAGCAVVSLLGAAVTKGKLSLLAELSPKSFVVATDADEAGDAAAERLLGPLRTFAPAARLRMPRGSDPMDMPLDILEALDTRMAHRRIK